MSWITDLFIAVDEGTTTSYDTSNLILLIVLVAMVACAVGAIIVMLVK